MFEIFEFYSWQCPPLFLHARNDVHTVARVHNTATRPFARCIYWGLTLIPTLPTHAAYTHAIESIVIFVTSATSSNFRLSDERGLFEFVVQALKCSLST